MREGDKREGAYERRRERGDGETAKLTRRKRRRIVNVRGKQSDGWRCIKSRSRSDHEEKINEETINDGF